MTDKRFFRLVHNQARRLAADCVWQVPDGWVVKISEPTRSLDQNAAQWPILEAFAEQLDWQINGRACKLTADEWKDILTSAFRQDVARIAPGLDGGMVLLGARTSQFGKREFSDWLEFLQATAAERGVVVYQEDAA